MSATSEQIRQGQLERAAKEAQLNKLNKLKVKRDAAIHQAELAAAAYARECDVGAERIKAFDILENVRNAGRVYL